jgi:hypothetical protein
VLAVAYIKKVMRASGAITDVLRRFELRGAKTRVAVKLDGAKVLRDEKEEAWRRLVAASQELVEPRLRTQGLERLRRHGEPIGVGRLELTRDGFSHRVPLRSKQFEWSDYGRAFYVNSRIRVLATPAGGKERKVADIDTDVPNAVLLPRLMEECAAAFGGR